MKIGIVTFHWGTNYGAILQAWCLQEYLMEQGHSVDIINYKPQQFDFSWLFIAKHPSLWKTINRQLANRKKEAILIPFRERYLRVTKRYYSLSEFDEALNKYDVLISGSDQVLNPGFAIAGDNGRPSDVYWLGFGRKDARRIGYAVSFGCEYFPEKALNLTKKWVNNFDAIGVREKTGLQILRSLEFKGVCNIIPDPTLLLGKTIFDKFGIVIPSNKERYTCVYMLRHEIKIEGNVQYIDEKHKPLSMEQWINTIVKAQYMVTNSYHGMIIALFSHIPFVVLLETGGESGMNDRFYTLLEQIGCGDRIAESVNEVNDVLNKPMNFTLIDSLIKEYKGIGEAFLHEFTK